VPRLGRGEAPRIRSKQNQASVGWHVLAAGFRDPVPIGDQRSACQVAGQREARRPAAVGMHGSYRVICAKPSRRQGRNRRCTVTNDLITRAQAEHRATFGELTHQ
jgi:hypothetical protein